MPELDDLSGSFNPNITYKDFSKDFLLKLIQVWQYAWLHMTEAWYDAVKDRFGSQAADECETQAWVRIGERVNPRYAKVANIQLNTVVDSLKAIQLPLDNTMGGLFQTKRSYNSNGAVKMKRQIRHYRIFHRKTIIHSFVR